MEHLQLIADIFIFIVLIYIAFLKSYFVEKGKNLATKEDVEDITSKIESIKSQLQFSLHAGLSWRQEEHDSLVEYYSKYVAWFLAITNCSFSEISEENESGLKDIRNSLETLERDFYLASGRMQLFVENSEVLRQHYNLAAETLAFHAHAIKATFHYALKLIEIRDMKARTPRSEQIEPYRLLLEQNRSYYRQFKEEQREFHSHVYPMLSEHMLTISKHLRQLVRNGSSE